MAGGRTERRCQLGKVNIPTEENEKLVVLRFKAPKKKKKKINKDQLKDENMNEEQLHLSSPIVWDFFLSVWRLGNGVVSRLIDVALILVIINDNDDDDEKNAL